MNRLGLALAGLLGIGIGGAEAAEIAPHRAIYVMTLDSAKSNSGVVGAAGTLAYEWGETCDGWTIEQRFKLNLQYEEDQPVELGQTFVTWESKNGLVYRFNERKTRNGQPEDEIKGDAAYPAAGLPGRANFTKPKPQSFDLPIGGYFPTAHTMMLIHKGESGEHFQPAQLFDGSTLDGAVLVSGVIGPTAAAAVAANDTAAKSPLLNRPSWRVRLAFFASDPAQERPDYEISMRLLDNGVSSEMTLDYGDYVIRAKLKEIEALPKPAC